MSARYSKPVYGHDIPWWIYDLTIAAGCLCFAWAAVSWSKLALVPLAVLLYGSFIEPRLLTTRRYVVGEGKKTLKIAYVSDIHVGPYKGSAWVKKLVRRTHALAPDLILLGGDFLHEPAKDLPQLEPLKDFRAPLGVYAILGNHDEYKASKEAHAWFAGSGVPLLENRSVKAKDGVTVAGADDDWYGRTDLEAAFKGIPSDDLAIVMLHNPDLAPHAAKLLKGRPGKTVFFSGHAHGGQIRLPFIGPVPPLPHHLGRKYDMGVFAFDGIPLVLGAGAGESGPRARLFCPPEIVLVTMRY
jgi:predicted MPP superfamily phosphohydrolase